MQNNSVILCCSVLLVEETGVPGVYDWPTGSYWNIVSPKVVSSTRVGIELTNFSDHRLWLDRYRHNHGDPYYKQATVSQWFG